MSITSSASPIVALNRSVLFAANNNLFTFGCKIIETPSLNAVGARSIRLRGRCDWVIVPVGCSLDNSTAYEIAQRAIAWVEDESNNKGEGL
jgi:hypothetical protein